MRFFIVLGALVAIGYFAFGKAFDAFSLKDAKKLAPGASSGVTMAVPPPAAGGSVATSIANSSVNMAPPMKPEMPTASRVVRFVHRRLPSAEFFTSYTQAGLQIVPDYASRSCFLRGPIDLVTDVADMLAKSDVLPGSCSLRGWVVWVADGQSDGWEFGAALGAIVDKGISLSITGSELVLDAGIGELASAIKILKDSSRVRVVQEPHVRLSDGVEARIESLEEVPIPETTLSNGVATQSINYKKVGLELVVLPAFLSSDRVRLTVSQVGGVVGRTVKIEESEIPVLQTQRVSSDIELAVGQSMVFGGVRSNRTKRSKGLLGDTLDEESGVLYVVLALYDDTPRARVVSPEWFPEADSMVLPGKGEVGLPR